MGRLLRTYFSYHVARANGMRLVGERIVDKESGEESKGDTDFMEVKLVLRRFTENRPRA